MGNKRENGQRNGVNHHPFVKNRTENNGLLPMSTTVENPSGMQVIEVRPHIVYKPNREGKIKPRRIIQVSFDGIPLRNLFHPSDPAPEAIVFEPGAAIVPESLPTSKPSAESDTVASSNWFPFPLDDKFIKAFEGTGIGDIHGLRRAIRSGVIKDILEYKGLSADNIAELEVAIADYETKRRRKGA